jgi:hypothetical protein
MLWMLLLWSSGMHFAGREALQPVERIFLIRSTEWKLLSIILTYWLQVPSPIWGPIWGLIIDPIQGLNWVLIEIWIEVWIYFFFAVEIKCRSLSFMMRWWGSLIVPHSLNIAAADGNNVWTTACLAFRLKSKNLFSDVWRKPLLNQSVTQSISYSIKQVFTCLVHCAPTNWSHVWHDCWVQYTKCHLKCVSQRFLVVSTFWKKKNSRMSKDKGKDGDWY